MHGGSCTDGLMAYTCQCTNGWTGDVCQQAVDPCTLETVLLGTTSGDYTPHDCDPAHATCTSTGPGTFERRCHLGYNSSDAARTCFDIDECGSAPCAHSASCSESSTNPGVPLANYSCSCVAGYAGGNCSYGHIAEYDALCNMSTGGTCSLDVDECASGPCLNGGNCSDSSTSALVSAAQPSTSHVYVTFSEYASMHCGLNRCHWISSRVRARRGSQMGCE